MFRHLDEDEALFPALVTARHAVAALATVFAFQVQRKFVVSAVEYTSSSSGMIEGFPTGCRSRRAFWRTVMWRWRRRRPLPSTARSAGLAAPALMVRMTPLAGLPAALTKSS